MLVFALPRIKLDHFRQGNGIFILLFHIKALIFYNFVDAELVFVMYIWPNLRSTILYNYSTDIFDEQTVCSYRWEEKKLKLKKIFEILYFSYLFFGEITHYKKRWLFYSNQF